MNIKGYTFPRLSAAATATLIILGGFCWSCSSRFTPASIGSSSEQLREAPDFSLKDQDGKEVHLSDYRGKVVALNFWATWCTPCKTEIPWLNGLQKEKARQGFEVIGIALDEQGWPVVEPFIKTLKVNYRVLMGDRQISRLYGGVDVLPMTLLIDREGRIAGAHAGVIDRRDFEKSLAKLLQVDVTATERGAARAPR